MTLRLSLKSAQSVPKNTGRIDLYKSESGLNQPFKYLLKKSTVRCHDNLAAGSS